MTMPLNAGCCLACFHVFLAPVAKARWRRPLDGVESAPLLGASEVGLPALVPVAACERREEDLAVKGSEPVEVVAESMPDEEPWCDDAPWFVEECWSTPREAVGEVLGDYACAHDSDPLEQTMHEDTILVETPTEMHESGEVFLDVILRDHTLTDFGEIEYEDDDDFEDAEEVEEALSREEGEEAVACEERRCQANACSPVAEVTDVSNGAHEKADVLYAFTKPVVEETPRMPAVKEQIHTSPLHAGTDGCSLSRRCCETPVEVDPFLLTNESALVTAPALRLDSNASYASSIFKITSRIGTNSTCTGGNSDVQTEATNDDRVMLQDSEVAPLCHFPCMPCHCGLCT